MPTKKIAASKKSRSLTPNLQQVKRTPSMDDKENIKTLKDLVMKTQRQKTPLSSFTIKDSFKTPTKKMRQSSVFSSRNTYTPRISRSKRAGLIFPVGRVDRRLREVVYGCSRFSGTAAVYMAAVIEYLVSEVCEICGDLAMGQKKKRIIPRHIMLALTGDEEFSQLCDERIFPGCGTLPTVSAEGTYQVAT